MTRFIIIVLLLMPITVSAQKKVKLKKKHYGLYTGTVAPYNLDDGAQVLTVSSSVIFVDIRRDNTIDINIGNNELTGTYEVMFEAKDYYLLDATMNGQVATERIMLYKRGKIIRRDGLYPQPVTELKKIR